MIRPSEIMVLCFRFADADPSPQLVGQALLQPAYDTMPCGASAETAAELVEREACFDRSLHELLMQAVEDVQEVATNDVRTQLGDLFWEAHSR